MAAVSRVSPKLQGSRQYLPSTFEERGIAVPFTTPILAHARVRKNYRDQLELSIPHFAGVEGNYIMAWKAVCDLVEPTLHDKMLFEHVTENRVSTPHEMRLAALSIACTGMAGAEVAAAAKKAVTEDEEAKALHQVIVILRLLEETNKGSAIDLREIASIDRQEYVRKALTRVSTQLDMAADALDQRITELTRMTYPVGAEWNPSEGRLRVQIRSLTQFRDALRTWGSDQVNEAGERALFSSEVADLTLATSAGLLKSFNDVMRSPYALVSAWQKSKVEAERLSSRLIWLLDGWDTVVQWWESCKDDNERIIAAEQMAPVLPLIPANELDLAQRDAGNGIIEKSRRWVRLNRDWSTGEVDAEMIHRMECVKARAL
ncbi:MAG TPA: hypothetical protein VL993_00035 [Stellaceae bacterium]|nr:hypothetical protein [Stellaceae bacterium]